MSGRLISIIDDDASLRNALIGLIRSLGHEARGFGSAEEFLDSTDLRRFDCIVTDIQMPGMSGIDLKHFLAARNHLAPVIMITARTEPGLEDKARLSGAVCLLRKPFEANTLIKYIETALNA